MPWRTILSVVVDAGRDAEWRKSCRVEGDGALDVAHRDEYVVEHVMNFLPGVLT